MPPSIDGQSAAIDEFRILLAFVLGRGCGQRPGTVIDKAGTRVRARTTPSAGALYPFEVLVTVRDTGTYLYDVDAGRLTRLAGTAPVPAGELARRAGLAVPAGRTVRALVTLVARPWTAMVKYGRRGYLYTYLDIGHGASNIALSARAAGLDPTVHLRFGRRQLAEALGLTGTCREPHVVLTLGDAGPAGDPVPFDGDLRPVWDGALPVCLAPPDQDEQANWASLGEVGSYGEPAPVPALGGARPLAEPAAAARTGRPVPLPRSAGPADDFTAVALRRHSARGFLARPVAIDQLAGLFDGLAEELRVDCADAGGPGVRARLLVRDVTGLAPGVYAYSPEAHALYPAGPRDADVPDDEVVSTCMGQASLGRAAALVHLHAALRPLLRERGRAGLAEIHFHAAHAAQRMCLNAARYGLGITCVGGFDEVRCAALTGLPGEEEVIYLAAVGVPDPTAYKLDRADIAYSHGRVR